MAIKRIQLRGISRTPSDRLTEDGGVAESLNVRLEDGEIAPITEPLACNEEFGFDSSGMSFEMVFIHKTNTYEHCIFYRSLTRKIFYFVEGEPKDIITISGSLKKITSLSNTLIVATSSALYYVLFYNGEYKVIDLNEDDLPKLSFVNINQKTDKKDSETFAVWDNGHFSSVYGEYVTGDEDNNYVVTGEDNIEMAAKIWDLYRELIDHNLALGCYSQPVMVRYAIRLFDNSYLWASSPIMLGSCLPKRDVSNAINFEDYESSVVPFTVASSISGTAATYVLLSCPYKIGVNFHRTTKLSELKDIITSIDIFLSTPIEFAPDGRNRIRRVEATSPDFDTCYRYVFDPANSENSKKREEAVLSASTFFLAKSYSLSDIPDDTDILMDDFRGEALYTKTQLDDSKVATILAAATSMGTYNGRLLAAGIDEYISRGIGVLNGQCANAFESGVSTITYAFAYHIPNQSLVIKDYSAKAGGTTSPMVPDTGVAQVSGNDDLGNIQSTPYAWITHPNPNCTKVTIKTYSLGSEKGQYEIEMKPHPYLSCSYAFLGIGERIYRDEETSTEDFESLGDSLIVSRKNVAAFSNVDNPLVFQLASKLTFNRDIKGFAIATEPMSTGQFGQFPLYFFLTDGIWTVTIANDGNFGSQPTLMSRDVCLNTNSITSTKNTVFFMSTRGLLSLSGREIINISERMHGKAYNLSDTLVSFIEGANFSEVTSEESIVPFYDFMALDDTKIAYDYVGERLICFNYNYDWQYVYSLNTNTWHRAQYGNLKRILNAYPRCIVTTIEETSTSVILYNLKDLTLSYDDDATTKKMMIATRPFDLGEPDVFKTITDARIRGQYAKGAVKFILLGSNDGITFRTINTLRGKAWKLFRIIILADLDATERISWIDVQYETKFTNRLR